MEATKSTGSYDFKTIEKKWQNHWLEHKTFKSLDKSDKPKYYVLDMFPYPSGDGLHVGHVEGYTATDIVARHKRMQGFNVLHPMGWDAFGLPAEQYAIKTNTHPKHSTKKNIENFKSQINSIGYSTDWDREVNTTDEHYFKWTQWIFLKLYEKGLAYESYAPVNWCPVLGTVLANEEVKDGFSEVGGHPVEKKAIRQWVLKITEYAERLLNDLDDLDWPESTKEMQRNWIGKSHGCQISFAVDQHPGKAFKVFTTRADTLFGASFCVLSPEHPLVLEITTTAQKAAVLAFIQTAQDKTDLERSALDKEKIGLFTGAYAINPANQEKLPIFIANYVLMTYGTGAIMAVPGHDERDHEFALKYQQNIIKVVDDGSGTTDVSKQAYLGDGVVVNSDFLNGLNKQEAIDKMAQWLVKKGIGEKTTTYRLRDWIFSRQRYWGEPFPIARDKDGNIVLVREEDLPVTLPDIQDFSPKAGIEPPLSKVSSWVEFQQDGKTLYRETNIMPQWAGSCWYYLRYLDPHNDKAPWDKDKEKYWMPVDLYVGGVEHANLHLLYARFWHKVLFDLGYVSTKEPFKKLFHQGMILGENNEKMSKSRGNVVNPTDVIKDWGADSLRLFEMFLGPLDQVKPWQTQGISGVHRFLTRMFRFFIDENGTPSVKISQSESSPAVKKYLAKTIKKVSEDFEGMRFNTALSAMMEFLNFAYKEEGLTRKEAESFLLMLAPLAPHMCEEIWEKLSHKSSLSYEAWPSYEAKWVVDDTVTLSVMINGKMRGTISVDKLASQAEIANEAKQQEFVKKYIEHKTIKKEIFVPGKIINFLVD